MQHGDESKKRSESIKHKMTMLFFKIKTIFPTIYPLLGFKRKGLNQVETHFIEFIAQKRNLPQEEVKTIFLETRDEFTFAGERYRKLGGKIHNLCKILYDDRDEMNLVDSYKFHELFHVFRMISYSYGHIGSFSRDFEDIAKNIIMKMDRRPCTIVDYGCGLGYISSEIGKLVKNSKVYLVDVDSLKLEFTKFRFDKMKISAEVIPITKSNLYPRLPKHNICIATDVMEHLRYPLKAYQNINEGLEVGGILFGNFQDAMAELFHNSFNLKDLRNEVSKSFQSIDENSCPDYCFYRKIK